MEVVYTTSNLAQVASYRHFAEHDPNQDPLVISLVQNESPALFDEALDGYLSELSELSSSDSEASDPEGERKDDSGLPKYKLENLSYAKTLLPVAQANSFFRLRKRKRKGKQGAAAHSAQSITASSTTKINNLRPSKNRSVRHRKLDFADPNRKTERLACTSEVDYGVSSSGWQGLNFGSTSVGRALVSDWENYTILCQLVSITRVPY